MFALEFKDGKLDGAIVGASVGSDIAVKTASGLLVRCKLVGVSGFEPSGSVAFFKSVCVTIFLT